MSVRLLCDCVCRKEIALLADITQITYRITGMRFVWGKQRETSVINFNFFWQPLGGSNYKILDTKKLSRKLCAIERIYYACPFNKFCALFTGFCASQTAQTPTHTHTQSHTQCLAYTQATYSVTQAFIHAPLRVSFRISQQLKHFLKVTNTHAFVNLYEKGIVAAMAAPKKKKRRKIKPNTKMNKTRNPKKSPRRLSPARMLAANPY